MRRIGIACVVLLSSLLFHFADTSAGETESRIVAKCIKSSRGEPATFASCTAKDLTLAEIKKCLRGSCFGRSNTIVKGLTWFNREVFNNCGFQAVGPGPKFVVMNTSSVTIKYYFSSECYDDEVEAVLNPGLMDTWKIHTADNWVFIGGVGRRYKYRAGGVMEFSDGTDGYVHQYTITPN